jgi:MFS family permease
MRTHVASLLTVGAIKAKKDPADIWIARIMISWGIVSTAIAFVQPLAHFVGVAPSTMFYLLRFLLGACEAGFAPGVVLYLSYWFPSGRQSQVLAAFFLALPIGTVIGAPLSGWILEALNGAPRSTFGQRKLAEVDLPSGLLVINGLSHGCSRSVHRQPYQDE